MPDRDAYSPGTPCWVDLMSPDVDASRTFYTGLFGWTAEDQHDQDGNRIYVMFRQDGKDVAGLGGPPPGMPADMPPVWNSYVASADVDATVAAAEAAGGKIMMPPMDVMSSGRMAILADPAGAAISVWQAGENIGAGVTGEPNSLSWTELLTRDRDGVRDFYAQTFGWSYDEMDMGPMGTYVTAKVGDEMVAGLFTMPAEMPDRVPNHWMVYFSVASTDEACAKVKELGGQVVTEPFAVRGVGRMATVHDPNMGSFSFMQEENA